METLRNFLICALLCIASVTFGCNTEDTAPMEPANNTNNTNNANNVNNTNNTNNSNNSNNGDCVPTGDELCGDGIDNDCDDEIDEGFEDLGNDCTSGLGVCEAQGTLECSEDLTTLECGAMPAQPDEDEEMTCDDIDNDCDGEVDEGCDNDMDGWCDEDMTITDSPAVCTNGVDDCNDEADAAYPGAPGVCGDNLDNDCDGEADNFAGIDQMDPTYELAGAGASSNDDDSPSVMATPATDGFCVAVHDSGTGDIGIGWIDLVNDTVDFDLRGIATDATKRMHDIAWNGTSCAVVYTSYASSNSQNQNVYLLGYEPGTSTVRRVLVVDEGATGTNGKFAALTNDGGTWLVAYLVQGDGSYYRTVPAGFSFNSTPSAASNIGLIAGAPAFGPSPNPADDFLFIVSFFNTAVYSFSLGTVATERNDLRFSTTSPYQWIEDVGGNVYRFGAGSSESEVVEFLDSYDLGNSGTVGYAAETDQEEVARHVSTAGPQSSKWYVDSYGDVAYTFEDDGTDINFTLQDHPNLSGELLSATTIGDEVYVLALTDAGTSGSMTQPATLTAYSYTCF